jgi:hypothetical protein
VDAETERLEDGRIDPTIGASPEYLDNGCDGAQEHQNNSDQSESSSVHILRRL